MIKITLVTVDFNNHEDTNNCLDSLQKLDTEGIDLSIIVVDNASKIPFNSPKKSNVHTIRTVANFGFTGGNNVGIQHALNNGAEYVVLLNNDTIVDKNLLQELLKGFGHSQNVGIVCPKIYFAKGHEYHKEKYTDKEKGKVIWYAGGSIDWQNVFIKHRGVDEVDEGQYDKLEITQFATGCCLMIKKEVLEKVGMFDDTYYLYFEDGDLSERVKRAGYRIVFQPKAILWHINAGSSGSGSNLHDYFLTRNRMIFGMRYAPFRTKIALTRESFSLFRNGRQWQKIAIKDYYLKNFKRGSFPS